MSSSVKIYDIFGEEIQRGRVICYAAESMMKMAIVDKVVKNDHPNYESYRIHLFSTANRKTKGVYKEGISKYNIFVYKRDVENRVMVLKDPLFYVDNKRVERQLRIADLAKERGIFPSSYELGEAVIENINAD